MMIPPRRPPPRRPMPSTERTLTNFRSTISTIQSLLVIISVILIPIGFFGIYSFIGVLRNNDSLFKVITDKGTFSSPSSIPLYIPPCTNETFGNETIIFDGLTSFAIRCPKIESECIQNVCKLNGNCEREFIYPHFDCYTNSDCNPGFECSGCVCTPKTPCSIDSDCDAILWSSCIENICVNGFCNQNFTENSTCASSENCGPGFKCESCICMPSEMDQCMNNSDCGMIGWTTCIESVCDLGTCFDVLSANSSCVVDGECDPGFECRNCTCQERSQCQNDLDCGVVEWTTCLERICNETGVCEEVFSPGSTCASNENCDSGFQCQNCTCVEVFPCETNLDCGVIEWTTCLERVCNGTGICEDVLSPGSTCVNAENCDLGFDCKNCTCVESPVIPCEIDSDCGIIEWTSCLTKTCNVTGFCEDVFTSGSNCASSENCDPGFECRSCMCTEVQMCTTDLDCGVIEWTNCLTKTCNGTGICEDVFSPGSTCASSENCGPGFKCENCTCMPSEMDQCVDDSDCGMVEWSECFSEVCDLGTCFSRLNGTSECVSSENCDPGFECRNCACVEVFPCEVDSDCGVIEWTTCLMKTCNSTGVCEDTFSPGSTCVSAENCDPGFDCKNCTCVESPFIPCEIDSDCGIIEWTTCLTKTCNATGFCEDVFSSGSNCANSENCDPGFECRNCTCQERSQCQNDLDCGVIEWTTCLERVCNGTGVCEDVLSPGSTCVNAENCDSGFDCKNCTCVESPVIPCEIDSDCGIIEWTSCLTKTCNATGFCEDIFSSGSTCASNENCDPGFECQNCTCQEVFQCETDIDCGIIEWTTCLERNCNGTGVCEDVFSPGSTCASNENCDPGFECQNCTCVEVFPCEDDLDCGVIEWTTCLMKTCNSTGICETVFSSGSNCASSENCDPGFECQNCICQEVLQCETDSDCGFLEWTTCLIRRCNSTGFCEDVLSPGSTCSDSSPCSSGQFCNSNCQCEPTTPSELSVQDNMFTLFDDGDATKELQIDVSDIPTGTTYIPFIQYDAAPTAQIIVGEDQITNTEGFSAEPVIGSPLLTYTLTRNGKMVFLSIVEVTGSFASANVFVSNVFIPVDMFPAFANMIYVIRILDNGTPLAGMLRVDGNRRIVISKIDGGNFVGPGSVGFYSTGISWNI